MLTHARAAMAGLMLAGGAALADPAPSLLEVTGRIADAPVTLTREDILALPASSIETSTVVTDGVHRFTGVLMRDVLAALATEGDHVTAIALNDYAVDIPVSDFHDYDVLMAYAMDGETLTREGKGPLWIVYPRDDHEALQDIRYDYRWVWQLRRLDVR